jgi:hypothetical protein
MRMHPAASHPVAMQYVTSDSVLLAIRIGLALASRDRLFRAALPLGASTESELVLAPTAIPGLALMRWRCGAHSVAP